MKQKTTEHGKLKIIPLGGLEQIGMNITAFEYEDNIIVVDCGLSFPEDDMLGIDLVIPDITYLKENIEKVKGFFITHGHEDHIGAIPYVLKEINVPIYATKLTIGIIDHKLKEHNMLTKVKRKVVKYGQHINLGNFRVEFIKTNHSIQDAAALAIYSPAGIVVHTGDFKVDYTPVFGDAIDLARLGEIGKKGVLALMCDSTNAERPGFTMSERTVGRTFDNIFSEHKNSRIIIATFASNVDRVQQIINSACKYGRKVVVEGRSMVNIISTATELGYLDIPDNTLIDVEHLKNRVHYEYYNLGMTENVPEDYTEISFVCLREDGCLELPATVETACRTAARKVPELEGFHFHTLRHTYTTNLLSNGAQPKDVQELLGHSDVSTTMNVYAHATREAKRESAKLLDKVVGMN